MTKKETLQLLTILKTVYPKFFISTDVEELKVQAETWYLILGNENFETVKQATLNLIKTLKFPPTIADVLESLRKIQFPNELSEQEAVNLIMKAISNSYNVHTAFKELPKILQRIVGSPKQLYSWGMMELDTVQSVIASNVGRSYRSMMKHHQEQQVINPQLTTEKRKELE